MKRFFFLIGILAVIFIGGYFVLTFYAVKFIQPYLQKVMGPGFTLEKTKLRTTYLSAPGPSRCAWRRSWIWAWTW